MSYDPASDRYDRMIFNRCGLSGLKLPAISLGLWQNFGDDRSLESKRAICRTAFDLGITHFDLANNYGPPPGSAEAAFGELIRTDFAPFRDEMIISSKAGYRMGPGPYGEWGSRKYLLSSLDRSLKRLGLDYVDIFYSHRFDPETPLEETMAALDSAVRQGKALYVGISNYRSEQTREAAAILKRLGTPCLIHQPRYSMFDRWTETDGLFDTLDEDGIGSIVFSPLAQGTLTDKYLAGIPTDSRAAAGKWLSPSYLSEARLAQMALAAVLRGGRVTSALIGASRPEQVVDCVKALDTREFSAEELAEIDLYAIDANTTPPARPAST
ncbi:MAG: aldo/keto reductase [Ancalomicrobiaceae bacterium]|nr:aldo/keto reductase [Ancalomicrobiaceae bacterium]